MIREIIRNRAIRLIDKVPMGPKTVAVAQSLNNYLHRKTKPQPMSRIEAIREASRLLDILNPDGKAFTAVLTLINIAETR